jgi:DNA-binding Lrp family transcriptional regulator
VDDGEDTHAAFRRRMLDEPSVQQCFAIVGQWDYVAVLLTVDLPANRALSRRLFVADPAVKRYETLPTSETVKSGLTVPLPHPGR